MMAALAALAARNKAVLALVAGVLNWGAFVVDSAPKAITANEWMMLAGIAATAFGVHQIPNVAPAPKAAVAAPAPAAV